MTAQPPRVGWLQNPSGIEPRPMPLRCAVRRRKALRRAWRKDDSAPLTGAESPTCEERQLQNRSTIDPRKVTAHGSRTGRPTPRVGLTPRRWRISRRGPFPRVAACIHMHSKAIGQATDLPLPGQPRAIVADRSQTHYGSIMAQPGSE